MNEPVYRTIETEFGTVRVMSDADAKRLREAKQARDAERDHRELVERARKGWDVPARHLAATVSFEGPWDQKLDLIRSGLGKGRSWALCGTRGNGKTQMAVQAMIETTGQGHPARYTTAVRFFAQIKATYRQDAAETELEVIARHQKPRLLVIDEIGKRGETAWEANMLFELLNSRYGDMTDTIVVANLSPEEIAESLGPSLSSRFNETGGLIHCDWPGRR